MYSLAWCVTYSIFLKTDFQPKEGSDYNSMSRQFPSAFQNKQNRNQRDYQPRYNPSPVVPAAPEPPKPSPTDMNETNFPYLGNNRGPNQMWVFDTSFAKRIEQTKQKEELNRLREERMKEDRIKAQVEMSGVYMVQRYASSGTRYEEPEEEEYAYQEQPREESESEPSEEEEDDGWTTVKNNRAFKPKQTLSVEQLATKYNDIEEKEPELHTTEEYDGMFEYGYRHQHG